MPKSNDIHFAQPHQQQVGSASANQQQQQLDIDPQEPQARTILSTSQKALILALPITLGHSFAGYEPGKLSYDSVRSCRAIMLKCTFSMRAQCSSLVQFTS